MALPQARPNTSLGRTRGRQSAKPKHRRARCSAQPLGGAMRTDLPTRSKRQREWKFVHFLAASAAVEVVILLVLRILLAFMGTPLQVPVAIRVVALVGAFLLLWFWVRMVIDFVRNRPE